MATCFSFSIFIPLSSGTLRAAHSRVPKHHAQLALLGFIAYDALPVKYHDPRLCKHTCIMMLDGAY
jgi:hypothetical protein